MLLNALIKRRPGEDRVCFGSPAIEIALDGSLIASHDFHYSRDVQGATTEAPERGSYLYRSENGGITWEKIDCIEVYWASFFKIAGNVFLIGCDRAFGNIVISGSKDCGRTWLPAKVLFPGGAGENLPNYHSSPGTTGIINRRIYRAFDNVIQPGARKGWQQLVISASIDSDLFNPSSWTMSNQILLEEKYLPSEWDKSGVFEWLEGNIVQNPKGGVSVVSCIRVEPCTGVAPIMDLSDDGRMLSFDPAKGFLKLPVGYHKFCIRRHPENNLYFAMGNNNTNPEFPSQRNLLSLYYSKDLLNWSLATTLIKDDLSIPWERSLHETGFQYPDFRFNGNDIVYLVRTAYKTSWFHDANQITFHRLKNYKKFLNNY